MSIFEILQSTGLPCAYSHFKTKQDPPFLVYLGNGQNTFAADNTWYHRRNTYQIEYYFNKKSSANEDAIEEALLDAGYQYDKSEDVYLEDQDMFLIYYYI